jgi:hypothetical protein
MGGEAMRRLLARHGIVLLLALVLLAGCRKKAAPAAGATTPTPPAPNGGGLQPRGVGTGVANMLPSAGRVNPSNDLKQIFLYYKSYGDRTRSPKKLEDLPDLQRDMPKVYQAIKDGVYVVYWDAPATTSGNAILAHVRDAPTKGGVVVRFDGSIANMTAGEFEAAPKAGK